jgi:hypothetical protein
MVPAVPPAKNCATIGLVKYCEAKNRNTPHKLELKEKYNKTKESKNKCLHTPLYLAVNLPEKFIGGVVDGKLRNFSQKHRTHALKQAIAPTFFANELNHACSTPFIG